MWYAQKLGGRWWLTRYSGGAVRRFRMVGELVAMDLADYLNGRSE